MGYYNEIDSLDKVIVKQEEKRASINNSKEEGSDDNLSADMDAISSPAYKQMLKDLADPKITA